MIWLLFCRNSFLCWRTLVTCFVVSESCGETQNTERKCRYACFMIFLFILHSSMKWSLYRDPGETLLNKSECFIWTRNKSRPPILFSSNDLLNNPTFSHLYLNERCHYIVVYQTLARTPSDCFFSVDVSLLETCINIEIN